MSRQLDNRWNRSGWLPTLEVVSWPRLEEFRTAHEAAVVSCEAAPQDDATLKGLCQIVERACRELAENWAEAEAALETESAKIRGPEPEPRPRAPEAIPLAELNRQAQGMEHRQRKHREKVRPQRQGVERDEQTLFGMHERVLAPRILDDARILPSAVVEARRARNRIAAAA